jgi:hypothetical protein
MFILIADALDAASDVYYIREGDVEVSRKLSSMHAPPNYHFLSSKRSYGKYIAKQVHRRENPLGFFLMWYAVLRQVVIV